MTPVLSLVLGGARSGKSRFAAEMAARSGSRVVYVATGVVTDPEMAARVTRHRAARPPGWVTVEEPLEPSAVVRRHAAADAVVVDCLGFAVSNRLLALWGEPHDRPAADPGVLERAEVAVLAEARALAEAGRAAAAHVIVVSNEVGLGPVPDSALGRAFRDLLGLANQVVAAAADAVYVTWAGIPVEVKALDARYGGRGAGSPGAPTPPGAPARPEA